MDSSFIIAIISSILRRKNRCVSGYLIIKQIVCCNTLCLKIIPKSLILLYIDSLSTGNWCHDAFRKLFIWKSSICFSKWVSMLCANIFLAFKFKNVDSDVFALASHQIQILLECKSSYYLLPSDTLSCTNCKIFALFKTTSAKECQNHGIWCVLKKYLFCNSKQKRWCRLS